MTAANFRGGQFGAIGMRPASRSALRVWYADKCRLVRVRRTFIMERSGAAYQAGFGWSIAFLLAPAAGGGAAYGRDAILARRIGRVAARAMGGNTAGERFGGQAARPEQNGASGGRSFGTGAAQPAAQWGGQAKPGDAEHPAIGRFTGSGPGPT